MLTLPIKQEWFDMICRGEKREEYREVTEYWRKRIDSARTLDYKQFKEIFCGAIIGKFPTCYLYR